MVGFGGRGACYLDLSYCLWLCNITWTCEHLLLVVCLMWNSRLLLLSGRLVQVLFFPPSPLPPHHLHQVWVVGRPIVQVVLTLNWRGSSDPNSLLRKKKYVHETNGWICLGWCTSCVIWATTPDGVYRPQSWAFIRLGQYTGWVVQLRLLALKGRGGISRWGSKGLPDWTAYRLCNLGLNLGIWEGTRG